MKTFNQFVKESIELFDNNTKNYFRNPNLSLEDLEKHSTHEDRHIRQAVASHPNINKDLLAKMATDSEHDVRLAVANHKNTSSDILNNLAKSPSSYIKIAVARHENTSPVTLRMLAIERASSPEVLTTIMNNKNADEETKSYAKRNPNIDNQFKTRFNIG